VSVDLALSHQGEQVDDLLEQYFYFAMEVVAMVLVLVLVRIDSMRSEEQESV
jgi:hypothetical protein